MKQLLGLFFVLVVLNVSAQKKYKIWVTDTSTIILKGVLAGITDSSVNIFPGKLSEYDDHREVPLVTHQYSNIIKIETHKKGGLLRGILIGSAVGLSPVLIGSIFGPSVGQGGAYVSIITFPVGIITGAIVGSTSKKKFSINRDASKFYSFRKRMKY